MTRILIAEDNDLNLKLMMDILLFHKYEVDAVQDGEAALNKIMDYNYDLFLLDLQMPKISGFEVLQALNNKGISVKTIVVSACAMTEEIDRAKNLGCIDFITKPISLNEFVSTIKKVLD